MENCCVLMRKQMYQRHSVALDKVLAHLWQQHWSRYSQHVKRFHPLKPGLDGCNEVHQYQRQPGEPGSRILGKHLAQLSSVFSYDLTVKNREEHGTV